MVGAKEFYGYEIHQELAEKDINVGIGRLYSILGEMKSDGLIWSQAQSLPNCLQRQSGTGKNSHGGNQNSS
ncbi:MAG: helix-turn-helix transcriptional regulator [Candidatus Thorarchaeota archaeon]